MSAAAVAIPTRPALRYYGGKWRIAPWIIAHFPPHDCFVDAFAGSGAILLRKPPELLEVYNDQDGEVVNFFRVLRDRTGELLHQVELTPYSREELNAAYVHQEDLPDLERARRFFVRSIQTRNGGRGFIKQAWRFQRSDNRHCAIEDWTRLERLLDVAGRFKGIQIECEDALKVIKRFDAPGTLFYCDPPYLRSVREGRWGYSGYAVEMGEPDQHRELSELLHSVKGMVLLSGYPSKLYDELYADWGCDMTSAKTDSGSTSREALWINAAALARLPQRDLGLEVSA